MRQMAKDFREAMHCEAKSGTAFAYFFTDPHDLPRWHLLRDGLPVGAPIRIFWLFCQTQSLSKSNLSRKQGYAKHGVNDQDA